MSTSSVSGTTGSFSKTPSSSIDPTSGTSSSKSTSRTSTSASTTSVKKTSSTSLASSSKTTVPTPSTSLSLSSSSSFAEPTRDIPSSSSSTILPSFTSPRDETSTSSDTTKFVLSTSLSSSELGDGDGTTSYSLTTNTTRITSTSAPSETPSSSVLDGGPLTITQLGANPISQTSPSEDTPHPFFSRKGVVAAVFLIVGFVLTAAVIASVCWIKRRRRYRRRQSEPLMSNPRSHQDSPMPSFIEAGNIRPVSQVPTIWSTESFQEPPAHEAGTSSPPVVQDPFTSPPPIPPRSPRRPSMGAYRPARASPSIMSLDEPFAAADLHNGNSSQPTVQH